MAVLNNISASSLTIRDEKGNIYEIPPFTSKDVSDNPNITYADVFSLVNSGLITINGILPGTGTSLLSIAPPLDGLAANVPANGIAQPIITISNPNHTYAKLIAIVTNNTTNAFTDFVIKTKSNPADASYITTYTKLDDYTNPAGYLQEVSTDLSTLSSLSGQARFIMDVYYFSTIQLAVTTGAPTNVTISYRLLP